MPASAPLVWMFAAALGWATPVSADDPDLAADLVKAARLAARAGRAAEARPAFLKAAGLTPEIRDWLLLRAAEFTDDSTGRAALYAEIRLPPARQRMTLIEAAARERVGDWSGAAVRYDSLGREADAWRVRLRGMSESERQRARTAMLARLHGETERTSARALVQLFLQTFPAPTAKEALTLARASTLALDYVRAVSNYAIAGRAGICTARDRLAWGVALAELGRHREAMTVLARVEGPPEMVAEARLRSARSRLRSGDISGSVSALWTLLERHPTEQEPAAGALVLLGDLARDRGEPAEARRIWLDLARRYPASAPAPRARFLAALVAYERGDPTTAAGEWDRLRADTAAAETRAAAGFWAGRGWERAGESERANQAWHSVLERDSLSYYAVASARRVGTGGWTPTAGPLGFQDEPGLVDALERIAVLSRLELERESGWERESLVADAAGDPERLLAVADGFGRAGQHAASIKVARQALAAGAAGDARTYRLLYPLGYGDELRRLAGETGLEAGLLAALIRQESAWEPRATSTAGARGLMQVMPATASQLARRLGFADWHPDRLYDPATNLRLGTAFFAEVLRRYGDDPVRALAAYNAGPTRVARWSERAPVDDPELFVERIPFNETRDYVRVVLRNLALYRALYDVA